MAARNPLDDQFAQDVLAAHSSGRMNNSGGRAPTSPTATPPATTSPGGRAPTSPTRVNQNPVTPGGRAGGVVPTRPAPRPAPQPTANTNVAVTQTHDTGGANDAPPPGPTPDEQFQNMLAGGVPVGTSYAFNPLLDPNSPLAQEYWDNSLATTEARNRRTDESSLALGNMGAGREFAPHGVGAAPTAPGAIAYDPLNPYTLQQGQIDQRRGNDGWLNATGALGLSMRDGRASQTDALNMFNDAAAGNGPSVAGDMVRANAQTAGTDTELAALRAGRMMGDANTRATSTYGQATADQAFAAERANQEAQSNIMQGNEQALLAQAALAAGARGGGMGAALRSAQNNTATQTQQNIVQASAAEQAAKRDADFIAANAQREAFAQQGFTNVAAGDAFAQAALQAQDTRAQADIEAARIRSGEQLHAMDMTANVSSDIRNQDLAAANTATDISRAGAELDRDVSAAQQADIDRRLAVEQMNRDYGLQADMANRDTSLGYDQLGLDYGRANQQGAQFADELNMSDDFQRDAANQGNRQANVDNYFGAEAFYGGLTHDATTMDANMGAGAVELDVQSDAAARNRLLDYYGIQQGVARQREAQEIQREGAWINAGATGLATAVPLTLAAFSMFSDERLKTDIDQEDDDLDVPDFRDAQNHSYRYKDPTHAMMRGKDEDDLCWGPMAQELPDHAVQEDDEGNLMVPPGELSLQLAPAVGSTQRRLDDVEELLRTLLDADLTTPSYELRKKNSTSDDEPDEPEEDEDLDLEIEDEDPDDYDMASLDEPEGDEFEDDDLDLELDLEEEDEEEEEPRKKKPKAKSKAKPDKGMADLAIMLLGPPPSAKKSKSKSKHSHSYGGGY